MPSDPHTTWSASALETQAVPGDPLSAKSQILDTGAAFLQSFEPVKGICAFLNAFHCYADEPGRYVEACHYCSHLNEGECSTYPFEAVTLQTLPDVRQCLIYDSPEKSARLIGGQSTNSS